MKNPKTVTDFAVRADERTRRAIMGLVRAQNDLRSALACSGDLDELKTINTRLDLLDEARRTALACMNTCTPINLDQTPAS